VVAMMSEVKGYIGVVQANQTGSLELTPPAKKWGRGRDDVLDHVRNGGMDKLAVTGL